MVLLLKPLCVYISNVRTLFPPHEVLLRLVLSYKVTSTTNTEHGPFVNLSLQKFIFHGNPEFTGVFKKTHLTLSLTIPIQSTHSTPIIKSPFQLTLHSNSRYLKWSFFKIPHKNRVHNFKACHAHCMCHPSLSLCFYYTNKTK